MKWKSLFERNKTRSYLNLFKIVSDHGNDDSAGWYSFRRLGVTEDTRFGVVDCWIFHVLVHLVSVAPRTTVKGHIQLATTEAIGCARPADCVSRIGEGDGARECRIYDGLDRTTDIHELSSDDQLGTSGERSPDRMEGFNDWIDKFVIVCRFAFKIGDTDDDRSMARFACLQAIN